MRASEEHDLHNHETRRLLGVLEQKDRQLAGLIAGDPGGSAEAVLSANDDVTAARRALDEHVTRSTHFVRNYRILDLDSGKEMDHFTVDYEVAPWTANRLMAAKHIRRYDLQEQQWDGSWLSYYPLTTRCGVNSEDGH